MKIRLEGREDEMPIALARIYSAFSVKSVSKFQSDGIPFGTSSHGYVYIITKDDV